MLRALWLQSQQDWDAGNVVPVLWAEPDRSVLEFTPLGREFIQVPGGTRGACHNAGLRSWEEANGTWPDFWHILDDDVVPSQFWAERLEAIIDVRREDIPIDLLGAWNEGAERDRGVPQTVTTQYGNEVVQIGGDFNIGGAIMCLPKASIERWGGYDDTTLHAGTEDFELTKRIRDDGGTVAIARTVHASILRDDGLDEEYRPFKQRQRDESLATLGIGPRPEVWKEEP